MAVKLHNNNIFLSLSSSNCWLLNGSPCTGRKVSDLHCLLLSKWVNSRNGRLIRHALLSNGDHALVGCRKYHLTFSKPRRAAHLFPFVSADDGLTIDGSPQSSIITDLEKMRVKLNSSLEDEDFCDGLVQSLYDAARVFELAIKEHKSSSSVSWFSTAWFGVDQNPWVKTLSFQESYIGQSTPNLGAVELESSDINHFEYLRNELIELEERVQISAYQSENNEELVVIDGGARYNGDTEAVQIVSSQMKKSIMEKSLDKLKETGMDIWQGTLLLGIDVAAAMVLVRRSLIGDELTEKEKETLKRTFTDMASVVPIAILMLLPITAIGHAAMLAAIQRYVPSLIPSTYAPERLDLLRQLEKLKQMTAIDVDPDEEVDEVK